MWVVAHVSTRASRRTGRRPPNSSDNAADAAARIGAKTISANSTPSTSGATTARRIRGGGMRTLEAALVEVGERGGMGALDALPHALADPVAQRGQIVVLRRLGLAGRQHVDLDVLGKRGEVAE